MNVHDEADLYLYVCWAEAALAPLLVGPAQDGSSTSRIAFFAGIT